MKKLFSLVIIILIILFINFTAWFMHTRSIKNAVENISEQLSIRGVNLNYKDIRFVNFTGWKVKAVIDDVSIKYGNDIYNGELVVKRLDITSQPLKKVIQISLPTSINMVTERKGLKENFTIKYDKPPFLRIHLINSLSTVIDSYKAKDYQSYKLVKQLLYFAEDSIVFDNLTKEIVSSCEQTNLWIVNDYKDLQFTSGIKLLISGLKYNPLHVTHQISTQKAHDKFVELGKTVLDVDLYYSESLDKRPPTDSMVHDFTKKIELKKISMSNEIFKFDINGNLIFTKIDPFPYMNINVNLNDYRMLINYYATIMNLYIDTLNSSQTIVPLKKINNEQKNVLSNIIKKLSFEKSDSIVRLSIIRDKDKTTISGKPILLIIKQLSALFFSNLQMADV